MIKFLFDLHPPPLTLRLVSARSLSIRSTLSFHNSGYDCNIFGPNFWTISSKKASSLTNSSFSFKYDLKRVSFKMVEHQKI